MVMSSRGFSRYGEKCDSTQRQTYLQPSFCTLRNTGYTVPDVPSAKERLSVSQYLHRSVQKF